MTDNIKVGDYECDVERLALKIAKVIRTEIPRFQENYSAVPKCIRCNEKAQVVPFQVNVYASGKVALQPDPNLPKEEYNSRDREPRLQYLTPGWFELDRNQGDWLCGECKEQIHKVGDPGREERKEQETPF